MAKKDQTPQTPPQESGQQSAGSPTAPSAPAGIPDSGFTTTQLGRGLSPDQYKLAIADLTKITRRRAG